MYPVTHMTIAAGSVWLGARIWRRFYPGRRVIAGDLRAGGTRAFDFDYRIVAFGALLPDLIDKPLKWYLFPDSLPDSHVYGHTLLLSAILIALGMVFAWRRGDTRLLGLGLGCLTHPLVDPVILYPGTLFWPALGTTFPDAESHIPVQWVIDLVLIAINGALLRKRPGFRERARCFARTAAL